MSIQAAQHLWLRLILSLVLLLLLLLLLLPLSSLLAPACPLSAFAPFLLLSRISPFLLLSRISPSAPPALGRRDAPSGLPLPPLQRPEAYLSSSLVLDKEGPSAAALKQQLGAPSSAPVQSKQARAQMPLPFVVLHGIGDACANKGVQAFVALLSRLAGGANGTCVEIGDGFMDSWFMRLDHQTDQACSKIKALPQLQSQGSFNLIGLSQGALIGRAIIQSCQGLPPVHNFISIGGPQAGVASTPNCVVPAVCRVYDLILDLGVYSEFAQNHLAPAGYVKIPNMLSSYLLHSKYLPLVNNEDPGRRNATFAQRLTQLNAFVLIKFEGDTVLFPPETAHFDFFAPNSFRDLIPLRQSLLYSQDWIGLRTLDEAGRLHFYSAPGNHLQLPLPLINQTIVPFLLPTPPPLPPTTTAPLLSLGVV